MPNNCVRRPRDENEAEVGPNPAIRRTACSERHEKIHADAAGGSGYDCSTKVWEVGASKTPSPAPFRKEDCEHNAPNRYEIESKWTIERALCYEELSGYELDAMKN